MSQSQLTILVSGMIAAVPNHGGATWAVLQYLLGLRQLGHTVYFIEPLAPNALQPAHGALYGSRNATYFHSVTEAFDLVDSAALLVSDTEQTVGLSYRQLQQIAHRADLLLNISGMLTDPELLAAIP